MLWPAEDYRDHRACSGLHVVDHGLNPTPYVLTSRVHECVCFLGCRIPPYSLGGGSPVSFAMLLSTKSNPPCISHSDDHYQWHSSRRDLGRFASHMHRLCDSAVVRGRLKRRIVLLEALQVRKKNGLLYSSRPGTNSTSLHNLDASFMISWH